MKEIELHGLKLKVMEEIIDEKYGRVWRVYLENRKTYVVEGQLIDSKEIIDELDNKYGIPVDKRMCR